jgi:hypothetical protein
MSRINVENFLQGMVRMTEQRLSDFPTCERKTLCAYSTVNPSAEYTVHYVQCREAEKKQYPTFIFYLSRKPEADPRFILGKCSKLQKVQYNVLCIIMKHILYCTVLQVSTVYSSKNV